MSKVDPLAALARRASRKLRKITGHIEAHTEIEVVDGRIVITSDCVTFTYESSEQVPVVMQSDYKFNIIELMLIFHVEDIRRHLQEL